MPIFNIQFFAIDAFIVEEKEATSSSLSILELIQKIETILKKNIPCLHIPSSFPLPLSAAASSLHCCTEILKLFIKERVKHQALTEEEKTAVLHVSLKITEKLQDVSVCRYYTHATPSYFPLPMLFGSELEYTGASLSAILGEETEEIVAKSLSSPSNTSAYSIERKGIGSDAASKVISPLNTSVQEKFILAGSDDEDEMTAASPPAIDISLIPIRMRPNSPVAERYEYVMDPPTPIGHPSLSLGQTSSAYFVPKISSILEKASNSKESSSDLQLSAVAAPLEDIQEIISVCPMTSSSPKHPMIQLSRSDIIHLSNSELAQRVLSFLQSDYCSYTSFSLHRQAQKSSSILIYCEVLACKLAKPKRWRQIRNAIKVLKQTIAIMEAGHSVVLSFLNMRIEMTDSQRIVPEDLIPFQILMLLKVIRARALYSISDTNDIVKEYEAEIAKLETICENLLIHPNYQPTDVEEEELLSAVPVQSRKRKGNKDQNTKEQSSTSKQARLTSLPLSYFMSKVPDQEGLSIVENSAECLLSSITILSPLAIVLEAPEVLRHHVNWPKAGLPLHHTSLVIKMRNEATPLKERHQLFLMQREMALSNKKKQILSMLTTIEKTIELEGDVEMRDTSPIQNIIVSCLSSLQRQEYLFRLLFLMKVLFIYTLNELFPNISIKNQGIRNKFIYILKKLELICANLLLSHLSYPDFIRSIAIDEPNLAYQQKLLTEHIQSQKGKSIKILNLSLKEVLSNSPEALAQEVVWPENSKFSKSYASFSLRTERAASKITMIRFSQRILSYTHKQRQISNAIEIMEKCRQQITSTEEIPKVVFESHFTKLELYPHLEDKQSLLFVMLFVVKVIQHIFVDESIELVEKFNTLKSALENDCREVMKILKQVDEADIQDFLSEEDE